MEKCKRGIRTTYWGTRRLSSEGEARATGSDAYFGKADQVNLEAAGLVGVAGDPLSVRGEAG